ncbi:NADPH oxidase 5 [Ischnura elegans]|uniref:NADPH oxidase 5 n=1 Tax=Ischnura elegans TaxID=197161 RepID=UPI001ED8A59E|nr:NADPH oxidase 5 [Ischnura elegans]
MSSTVGVVGPREWPAEVRKALEAAGPARTIAPSACDDASKGLKEEEAAAPKSAEGPKQRQEDEAAAAAATEELRRPVTPPPPCPPDACPPGYASLAAMSAMQEEVVRERVRAALLAELGALLRADALLLCAADASAGGGAATGAGAAAPGRRESSSGAVGRVARDAFRRLFTKREVLERLFRLFDQDRDDLLQQEEWVEFLKARLTDEKQIDFAEQLESVAYVLCGSQPIALNDFCQIFDAKGVLDKLFRLVDQDSAGFVTVDQVMEFLANLSNSRPRSGIDKDSLEWLERLFRNTVGDQREIRQEEFRKIVISKNPFFTERVFQIFDRDNSGSISLQEFIDAMYQFAGQSPDDKIRFLFKVYDIDGDGLIQHRELQHVMRACMEENGMRFSEEQVADLTAALFEDADVEHRGAITYEALKAQLEKHDGLLENLSISIDRWLVPPKPNPRPKCWRQKLREQIPYQLTLPYLRNNQAFISALAFILALNACLFASRIYEYWDSNVYVIVARACGQCLNLDCSLVLALMLRRCLTFLRAHGLSHFLPLDHHIYFHKLVGVLILGFSILHTIMHSVNFSMLVVNDPVLNAANWSTWEWFLTDRPGKFGLVPGQANPTGVALDFILLIIFICSQPFVRRRGSFEVFYWTHLLYVPFWILLIIHAPNFWKWFVTPGVIYLLERGWRLANQRARQHGRTYISSGVLLPSRVIHLVIRRPLHFDFCPGDYVFVNIPAVARYEWHPFTISSAPEQQDSLWLHVRAVGQWTNRLYEYFEREQERLHASNEAAAAISAPPPACAAAAAVSHPTPPQRTTSPLARPSPPLVPSRGLRSRFQASIERKLGGGAAVDGGSIRAVGFRRVGADGLVNEGFVASGEEGTRALSSPPSPVPRNAVDAKDGSALIPGGMTKGRKMTPDQKLHRLLLAGSKMPLAKSLSMPDMQSRAQKRERLMALREYMRSESERSFDEAQVRRARMQSLGLAYLSPQNKCVAQSFRYMRNKPTIIAFKTPSQDDEGSGGAAGTVASAKARRKSPAAAQQPRKGSFPEAVAEEGRAFAMKRLESQGPMLYTATTEGAVGGKGLQLDYPVGKPLEISVDGPYGAPSSHIFRAQHAVLIGTGIGVTPFASILQSIMHRYWKARHCCPNCKYSWASEIPPSVMNLRKVDFFWINRDQRSFEWFVNLLSQLEMEQAELGGAMERFLDMHMYITSALQKTDMKAVGLQLALDLLHQKEKRDLITGLKTRTNAGRPNWDKVFQQIVDQDKGKVTVFYCGPPQLARILRVKCDQFGFIFRKEVF